MEGKPQFKKMDGTAKALMWKVSSNMTVGDIRKREWRPFRKYGGEEDNGDGCRNGWVYHVKHKVLEYLSRVRQFVYYHVY